MTELDDSVARAWSAVVVRGLAATTADVSTTARRAAVCAAMVVGAVGLIVWERVTR